jgi:gamma-glutamyltranspeptidase/glutathione hydrolase
VDKCSLFTSGAEIAGMGTSNFALERLFDREGHRGDPAYWTVKSANGVVATAHYLATAARVGMLSLGGNAVDAAVAASLAIGVCEPAGSGLGGMSLMLIHLAASNRTFTVEGPCRAPLAATPEAVAEARRYRGYRAVAVPTNAAVLEHALSNYGTLSRSEVIAPAIELAEDGYPVTPLQHLLVAQYLKALQGGSAGAVFLDSNGCPPVVGSRFRQPALARTLRRLAEAGPRTFIRVRLRKRSRRIWSEMVALSGPGIWRSWDLHASLNPSR